MHSDPKSRRKEAIGGEPSGERSGRLEFLSSAVSSYSPLSLSTAARPLPRGPGRGLRTVHARLSALALLAGGPSLVVAIKGPLPVAWLRLSVPAIGRVRGACRGLITASARPIPAIARIIGPVPTIAGIVIPASRPIPAVASIAGTVTPVAG